MHIGIIRFSSMGDVLLQTPWLAWLKKYNKNIKISFITLSSFRSLVESHPFIDEGIYIDKKSGLEDIKQLWPLAKQIEKNIDIIFDLHGTLRSSLIRKFCFSVPVIKVYKRSLQRSLLVRTKWDTLNKLESHHTRIINDFSFLGDSAFDTDDISEFLKLSFNNPKLALTSLSGSKIYPSTKTSESHKYIAISPIASFEAKRWPMSRVRELIKELLKQGDLHQYKIIIVAGPDDTYCDEIFDDELAEEQRVVNLQGKTSLKETIEYLKQSEICITNDTGTSHISESLGRPVVSIFGPTSESFGFRPHLDESVALSALDIKCRPCSATGKKACTQKELLCMQAVSVDMVMKQVKRILKKNVLAEAGL